MCTPEQLDGEKWSFVSLPSRSVRSPRLLVSAHDYRDEVLRKGVGLLAWADSKKGKGKRRDTTAEPLRNRGATHTPPAGGGKPNRLKAASIMIADG